MFYLYIHFYNPRNALDPLVHECFTRYSSDPTPLLYLFCILYDVFASVSWLHTILLCYVAVLFKVIIEFMSSINPWVILLIRSRWEIFRMILVRSRYIVHPTKSSNLTIDIAAYYFLVNSTVFISSVLPPIDRVLSTYTMTMTSPSLFTIYSRQESVLHYLNPALRVIFLVYYLNQQRAVCRIT